MVAFALTTVPIGFCSSDPIGYVDGPMLYQYVRSGPTNWIDGTGTESVQPNLRRCYACCCCPVSIDIKHDLDPARPPILGAPWAIWGRVRYFVKLKFTRVPSVNGTISVRTGENTCSIEFWEYPFRRIPSSNVNGGGIPDGYDWEEWNDAVDCLGSAVNGIFSLG
jgi:hypothetical protein